MPPHPASFYNFHCAFKQVILGYTLYYEIIFKKFTSQTFRFIQNTTEFMCDLRAGFPFMKCLYLSQGVLLQLFGPGTGGSPWECLGASWRSCNPRNCGDSEAGSPQGCRNLTLEVENFLGKKWCFHLFSTKIGTLMSLLPEVQGGPQSEVFVVIYTGAVTESPLPNAVVPPMCYMFRA